MLALGLPCGHLKFMVIVDKISVNYAKGYCSIWSWTIVTFMCAVCAKVYKQVH